MEMHLVEKLVRLLHELRTCLARGMRIELEMLLFRRWVCNPPPEAVGCSVGLDFKYLISLLHLIDIESVSITRSEMHAPFSSKRN